MPLVATKWLLDPSRPAAVWTEHGYSFPALNLDPALRGVKVCGQLLTWPPGDQQERVDAAPREPQVIDAQVQVRGGWVFAHRAPVRSGRPPRWVVAVR
ncbi:MAG: hypothetical protein ACRDS9_08510 [Pseudonocardiaceae bacterium]